MWRLLFLRPGARFLIFLKLVEIHLRPEWSEISPHPWALCLWKPSSFLDRRAQTDEAGLAEGEEGVWTVEMMALIGWKMTWFEQAEAWVEEEEA